MSSPLRLFPLVLLLGGLSLTACGSDNADSSAPSAPQPSLTAPASTASPQQHSAGHGSGPNAGTAGVGQPTLYAVQSGPLGVVVTDGSGRVMYRSDADIASPSTSNCLDSCIQTWIPVTIADRQEPELLGVDTDKVGRLSRPDGTTQLTLAGWPLYTNRDDDGTLRDAGPNGTDNTWFAISPTGEKAAAT